VPEGERRARPGQERARTRSSADTEREREGEQSQDFSWMLSGLEDSVYNCAPC